MEAKMKYTANFRLNARRSDLDSPGKRALSKIANGQRVRSIPALEDISMQPY